MSAIDPYVTLTEAAQGLRAGAFTATELARAQLDRIAAVDERVKAYVTVTRDEALADAARADEALARGDAGPLTGIPIAIKDLIVTKGVRTTCSSRMLENFVPVEDATA